MTSKTIDLEEAVIGALILRPNGLWDIDLSTDDFLSSKCGRVYRAICELHQDGLGIDPVTIEDHIQGKFGINADILFGWTNKVLSTEHIATHAERIRMHAREREIRKKASQIVSSKNTGDDLLREAYKLFLSINDNKEDRNAQKIKLACGELEDEIDRVHKGGKQIRLNFGLREIDHFMAIQPGGVFTIAGRPSMGKSAMAQWMVNQLVTECDERVLVFTTESDRVEYLRRLVSLRTGINSRAISAPGLPWDKMQLVKYELKQIEKLPLWIDDTNRRAEKIIRQIRRAKQRYGITVVVIDHLQEIAHQRRGRDVEAINETLMDLRGVCRENPRTYLIQLSQLNRDVERRESKRPLMSDLKASGKIEEMSDIIGFVVRPAHYFPNEDRAIMELGFGKNRNGPIGMCKFDWNHRDGYTRGPIAGQKHITEQDWEGQ
jgi:replicative DNA helicase